MYAVLLALLLLCPTVGLAQNFGNIKPHTVLGNPTDAPAPAQPIPAETFTNINTVEHWGSGIVGDGVADDTAAFNSALAALAAKGGGEVVATGKYRFSSGSLVIPSNVRLRGPWAHPGTYSDYPNMPGSLILDPAYSVHVMTMAGLQGMVVRASNLVNPAAGSFATVMASLYAIRNNMVGTGICLGDCTSTHENGTAAVVRDNLIIGFNQCLISPNSNLYLVENNYGDCTNGFKFGDTGELGSIVRNHTWPFLTYGAPGGTMYQYYMYSANIQSVSSSGGTIKLNLPGHNFSTSQTVAVVGVANNINANGLYTITKLDADNIALNGSTFSVSAGAGGTFKTDVVTRTGVAHEFYSSLGVGCDECTMTEPTSFGWKIGVKVTDTRFAHILAARLDYYEDIMDYTSKGIVIDGTSVGSLVTSPKLAGYGTGYYMVAAGAGKEYHGNGIVPRSGLAEPYHTMLAPHMWGITWKALEVDADIVSVIGGTLAGAFGGVCTISTGGGFIHLDGGVQISLCTIPVGAYVTIGAAYDGGTRSPMTPPLVVQGTGAAMELHDTGPGMGCQNGGWIRLSPQGNGYWDLQFNKAPNCDFSQVYQTIQVSPVGVKLLGTFLLDGVTAAANCTGIPSATVISTTGTGVLVRCP